MADLRALAEAVKAGRAKEVKAMVTDAIAEGVSAESILNEGLVVGMTELGEMFKNNVVYVPEVLIAARAMNAGMEILKPMLAESGQKAIGKVAIGTVKGDLHDIGKNLVRMMIEGKGIDVVDLGVDVPAEKFLDSFKNDDVDIVCCSALLTTTMGEMKNVVDIFNREGLRDKVTIMIGGAPITDAYCKSIGADYYTPDAASAADVAKEVLLKKNA